MSARIRAVFLDKDGTLIENIPYNTDPERIRLAPGAAAALPQLSRSGFRLVVVSNQSGIARGFFPESALQQVKTRISELMAGLGVPLDGFYYCPHGPDSGCPCRKPQPGLLWAAARDLNVDLDSSWLIGDILDDIEAGRRAGCHTVLIDNGNETEWRSSPDRHPDFVAGDLHEAAAYIVGGVREAVCR